MPARWCGRFAYMVQLAKDFAFTAGRFPDY